MPTLSPAAARNDADDDFEQCILVTASGSKAVSILLRYVPFQPGSRAANVDRRVEVGNETRVAYSVWEAVPVHYALFAIRLLVFSDAR